jgi:hypothetical protein
VGGVDDQDQVYDKADRGVGIVRAACFELSMSLSITSPSPSTAGIGLLFALAAEDVKLLGRIRELLVFQTNLLPLLVISIEYDILRLI